MPLETPARIAILGAGPIGLEAALYARFLGYDVDLFERAAQPAEYVRAWGHVRLFSPFGMNASPLGIAAIQAQDPTWQPPTQDALQTGHEFVERYLHPLAATDLVQSSLHPEHEVQFIGRADHLKRQLDDDREDDPFVILTKSPHESERIWLADGVLDTTGTFGNHKWAGQGGVPAIGERDSADAIEYGLPDVLGRDRDRYADKHTLVVGAGYSAATTVAALAELDRHSPQTRVTWLTRSVSAVDGGPIRRIPNDRLPERDRIAEVANALAANQHGAVKHIAGVQLRSIKRQPARDPFEVTFVGNSSDDDACTVIEVDRIVANVGFRPDRDIYRELQVHECYASEGPMKLAASLLENNSADCLDQTSAGAETLLNPEPNFFILGSKSYGRGSQFLLSTGQQQIVEAFTIIGDNPDLNLYRSIRHQRAI